MTNPHRRTLASAALAMAGYVLVAGCSSTAPVAKADTPTVQTTAGAAAATPATSIAPTNPAGTDATPATVPAAGTAACALVTEQEVGTVLGSDPGAGSAFTSHGASQCQYGSYATAFVLVNLNPTQGKPFYDHARNNPQVSQVGAVTDVAGVGDRAFGIFGHGTASIYFNKGDALVLVMVEIRTASSPPKAQALDLAKTAASRI